MKRILVIEDQADIRELIKMQLELKDYQVTAVENGHKGIEKLLSEKYDLALIDRMLPDTSGIQVCKTVRDSDSIKHLPIILVTALSEPENIIEGLDAGADDYITKPFDINILHARVRALLRRNSHPLKNETLIEREGLSIDINKCRVLIDDSEVTLTNTEFQILSHLSLEPGIVHSRKKLLELIMGQGVHVTSRTIDTHIAGLRKKLGNKSQVIETIRGVGYRFKDE
jgi:DNA-binding response OmpR family regulator